MKTCQFHNETIDVVVVSIQFGDYFYYELSSNRQYFGKVIDGVFVPTWII